METILVFRIGSLGDTVVALPCFHRIAKSFPGARRILITDIPATQKTAPAESVLGKSGLIDGVIYFPPPPRRLNDVLQLRREIAATGARTLIYVADRPLAGTLRDMAFFYACGIRHIVGAPLAADVRRLRTDAASGATEREAERLARCLQPLGPIAVHDPASWDLLLSADEIAAAEEALSVLKDRGFIAMSAGAKIAQKDWGEANWRALLALMEPHLGDTALVFFGSGDEAARADAVASGWRGQALNLCGRLSPRQSAAAMRRARFFIGHDGGPLHLAAAMGVTCIGIYGDYNQPKWWHPMGDRHRIIHDRTGVAAISPATVFAQVSALG